MLKFCLTYIEILLLIEILIIIDWHRKITFTIMLNSTENKLFKPEKTDISEN